MSTEYTEHRPTAQDGTRLYLQRWAPTDVEVAAELLVVHGYAEHSGRYRELGHALAGRGIAVAAVDYRGHGRAEGPRGFVTEFECYHDDLDAALATLDGRAPRFILGHSNGGLLVLDYVARNGPRVADLRGAIVTNPLLALAMEVPGYKLFLANTLAKIYPRFTMPSGIPTDALSRQEGVREAYERDPFIFNTATAGWFIECRKAQTRVRALHRLPLPCLYVYSDSDPITSAPANRALAEQLEGEVTIVVRAGELHEVLNEIDREDLYGKIADWILGRS